MHNTFIKDIVYVELVLRYLAAAYVYASGPASGKQVSAIFQVIHSLISLVFPCKEICITSQMEYTT